MIIRYDITFTDHTKMTDVETTVFQIQEGCLWLFRDNGADDPYRPYMIIPLTAVRQIVIKPPASGNRLPVPAVARSRVSRYASSGGDAR